jgi:hypothetical protein
MTNERVQCNAAGQVVLKLKTPWHDDATHSGMSPAEFTQRLAALMPRPRLTIDERCARRTARATAYGDQPGAVNVTAEGTKAQVERRLCGHLGSAASGSRLIAER